MSQEVEIKVYINLTVSHLLLCKCVCATFSTRSGGTDFSLEQYKEKTWSIPGQ